MQDFSLFPNWNEGGFSFFYHPFHGCFVLIYLATLAPILPLFNCVSKYNWENKEIHLGKGKWKNKGKIFFKKLHYLDYACASKLFLIVTPGTSSASDIHLLLQCHPFAY